MLMHARHMSQNIPEIRYASQVSAQSSPDGPFSSCQRTCRREGRRDSYIFIACNKQDAASDLYGSIVMSPSNYTGKAEPRYETYGVPTEFTCVPPRIRAPFNRTEFRSYA